MLKSSYFPFWIFLLIGLAILPLRVTNYDFTSLPGDLGDARFNNYILEHGYRFITFQEDSFWNAPFMYPEEKAITLGDNLIGVVPVYSVFRIFGFDRETSFQLLFWAICILNFLFAYIVLKKIFHYELAAAFGAFLFAFGLPVVAQINHIQLLPRFFVPFAIYYCWLFFTTLEKKHFFFLVVSFVAQFYCSMYIGFILLLTLIIFAGVLFITNYKHSGYKDKIKLNWLLSIFGVGILGIILISPLLFNYFQRAQEIGMRPWEEIEPMLPRIKSFFYAGEHTFLWNILADNNKNLLYPWEHHLFSGITPILFLILFFIYRKKLTPEYKRLLSTLFITGIIIILLFISIKGFTLYDKLVYPLPGFGSMRAPLRLILVLLFLFSIIIAGILTYKRKQIEKYPMLWTIFLCLFIVADQGMKNTGFSAHLKKDNQERIIPLVNELKKAKEKGYEICAYVPETGSDDANLIQLDGMLAAQSVGLKSINGYSSSSPEGYNPVWITHTQHACVEWLNFKNKSDLIDKVYFFSK